MKVLEVKKDALVIEVATVKPYKGNGEKGNFISVNDGGLVTINGKETRIRVLGIVDKKNM